MKTAPINVLEDEERAILDRWARGRSTTVRLMQRAQIVLRAATSLQNRVSAAELGITPNTVGRWRRRFAAQRIEGIEKDLPRAGRQPDTEV